MPAVLVHGVPDTHHMWDAVRAALARADVITPRLPGFAAPAPANFDFGMDAYAAWLIGAIETVGEPVDLVGHDWGGLLSLRVACLRPDLVRAWAIGGVAIDETYVWHEVAQLWQTPGVGEELMAGTDATALAAALVEARMPAADAQAAAGRADDAMKAAILALYRSAVDIGAAWSGALDQLSPHGLVLWGEHDPYAAPAFGERLAARSGATFHLFKDCGHWWPLKRPADTARALEALWASVS